MNTTSIYDQARIGHVHLRVSDLARATAFYRDVLGLRVVVYGPDRGFDGGAFLAIGDSEHSVALNTWHSEGGTPPPTGHTGLHHFAIVLPDRDALGRAVARLYDHEYPIDAAEDHGGTVAVYLTDPDGNGIELAYERPRAAWFDEDGDLILRADPLDPRELLGSDHPTPAKGA
jgi:catechol 2,3-dioxygenase